MVLMRLDIPCGLYGMSNSKCISPGNATFTRTADQPTTPIGRATEHYTHIQSKIHAHTEQDEQHYKTRTQVGNTY